MRLLLFALLLTISACSQVDAIYQPDVGDEQVDQASEYLLQCIEVSTPDSLAGDDIEYFNVVGKCWDVTKELYGRKEKYFRWYSGAPNGRMIGYWYPCNIASYDKEIDACNRL